LSVAWPIAGNEIMKNTVSSGKNFRIAE